jgi:hypothetical protein
MKREADEMKRAVGWKEVVKWRMNRMKLVVK